MQKDDTANLNISQSKVDSLVAEIGPENFRTRFPDQVVTEAETKNGALGGSYPNPSTLPEHVFTVDYSYKEADRLLRKAQEAGLTAGLVTTPLGAQRGYEYGESANTWSLMFSGPESATALRTASVVIPPSIGSPKSGDTAQNLPSRPTIHPETTIKRKPGEYTVRDYDGTMEHEKVLLKQVKRLLRHKGIVPKHIAEPYIETASTGRRILGISLGKNKPGTKNEEAIEMILAAYSEIGLTEDKLDQKCLPNGLVVDDPTVAQHYSQQIMDVIGKKGKGIGR